MDAAELKMEIDILKVLNGQAYNLLLESIYESPSKVYVVTEICSGGEMLEYAGNNFKEGLRTEDVSRMAFQLLSAVDHCDRYNILHRDIKPENISEFVGVVHGILYIISSICSFILAQPIQLSFVHLILYTSLLNYTHLISSLQCSNPTPKMPNYA